MKMDTSKRVHCLCTIHIEHQHSYDTFPAHIKPFEAISNVKKLRTSTQGGLGVLKKYQR